MTPPKGWVEIDHFDQAYANGYNPNHGNPYIYALYRWARWWLSGGHPSDTGYDEFYAFYRVADGTEGNAYTFTMPLCPEDEAGLVAGFSGVNQAGPLDPSEGEGGHRFNCGNPDNPQARASRPSPVTINGFRTQSAGDLIWACLLNGYDQNTFSTPTGYNDDLSAFTSHGCCDIQGFDRSQSSAGPTGDLNSRMTHPPPPATPVPDDDPPTKDNWFGEMIALRPPAMPRPLATR
jgi:hypothetical protein